MVFEVVEQPSDSMVTARMEVPSPCPWPTMMTSWCHSLSLWVVMQALQPGLLQPLASIPSMLLPTLVSMLPAAAAQTGTGQGSRAPWPGMNNNWRPAVGNNWPGTPWPPFCVAPKHSAIPASSAKARHQHSQESSGPGVLVSCGPGVLAMMMTSLWPHSRSQPL